MALRFKVKEEETDNIFFLTSADAATAIGGVGSGVDNVARTAAATAQAQADANLASLNALTAGNATDAEVAAVELALQNQIDAIVAGNATQAELDTLQSNVQSQIDAINAANATQTELDAIQASLQAQITANNTATATAQSAADTNTAAITAINLDNATQTELDAVEVNLQTQITANNNAATAAQNTADTNTTTIAAINADNATQTELDAVEATLQTQITANISATVAAQSTADTNTAAITAINADNATQTELDAAQAALQAQIDSTNTSLAAEIADNVNDIRVVPSLTINVPNDQPTIQDALDEAAHYVSLDGRVVIEVEDGEYNLPAELQQSNNQFVEIRAVNSVVALRKAGYANNKAADLITAKAHYNVVINNTGTLNFLGGNSNLNIQFTGILFVCNDLDNYVLYLRNREYAYFVNCTIFGGRLGLSVYEQSEARLIQTTFLHQSLRCLYSWNGSTINSDFTSFLYAPRSAYFINGCSAYMLRSEVDAGVAGMFCQHGSTLYVRGGDHTAVSYNFYTTNSSNCYVLTTATIQGSFNAPIIGYAYYNSTLQLSGAVTDFDMTGVSGTYVARALHHSHLLLSAAINAKTARLDNSSSGVSSTATCTFSPAKTVVGNNNSLWI